MPLSHRTAPLVLIGLLLGSCTRPQFTITIAGLNDTVDTLYVNAALESPAQSNSNTDELTFDLKPYTASGSFDFGLVLNPPKTESGGYNVGFVDLAFTSGSCIKQIRRIHIDGNPPLLTPPVSVTVKFTPETFQDQNTVVPIDTRSGCITMKRPLITSVQREIVGIYGTPETRLVLSGWGLTKGTKVKAKLALPNKGCGEFCSAWEPADLTFDEKSSFSTTRMAFGAAPLTAKVSPLLEALTQSPPIPLEQTLVQVNNAKTKAMTTAVFSFSVTATSPDGLVSDTFSEWP